MVTTTKNIRIDDQVWSAAGVAAQQDGTDRSALVREFFNWYLRVPGAELPTRPGDEPKEDPRVVAARQAVGEIDRIVTDLRGKL